MFLYLQKDAEDIIPIAISQDMSDTMRQILIERIDSAVDSTGGDVDIKAKATVLKDSLRLWLDKARRGLEHVKRRFPSSMIWPMWRDLP